MSKIRIYKKGVKVQITKNFASTEFDCSCKYPECQSTILDVAHIELLQKKREEWNKPVKITSAYRCQRHNKDVGGASQSRHILSDATDIQVVGMTPDQVADSCESFDGLGRYNTFTHIDSRGSKSRWDFRKK
jgi:uncharacterized protein YcbK (DUF882 family)